jgi:hypothetical protein
VSRHPWNIKVVAVRRNVGQLNLLKPSGFFTYHQVQHSKILHGTRFALNVLCSS